MDEDRQEVRRRMIRVLDKMLDNENHWYKTFSWLEYMTTNALPAWIEMLAESDVPTGQIPSAKNLKTFRFKCCTYWQTNYREPGRCAFCGTLAVKAVAADTNEECEAVSQAHTGTKK